MSTITATFTLVDWAAQPCRECGGSHGQMWMAGLPTREEYEAAYDEMAHPWKYADRPRVAQKWHLFPRTRRLADTLREARDRIGGSVRVLRHGYHDDY